MASTVRLSGFSQLEEELAKVSKAVGKGAVRRALMKSAEPMAEIARGLAPDDPATNGKDLKSSIVVGVKLNGRQTKLHRRMFRDDKAAVEMFVGPSYLLGDGGRHGHLLEFGTSAFVNKGRYAGTQNPGIAPQPFMRPAWDQDHMPMLERLGKEMWDEIQKSVARAQARAAKRG